MASQGERIATLEAHRGHDSELLERLDGRMDSVERKVDDIHSGMRAFIVIARVFAAFGVAVLAFKGVVPWKDVAEAFRSI
jgi:hypothetical protein